MHAYSLIVRAVNDCPLGGEKCWDPDCRQILAVHWKLKLYKGELNSAWSTYLKRGYSNLVVNPSVENLVGKRHHHGLTFIVFYQHGQHCLPIGAQ